ncbi:MAG: 7-cyano-7-deazaguanine synthase QueC [Myxococcota bacterium]
MAAKAVVLLSGGLDSATVLGIARAEGFSVSALCFDYGQRHKAELLAAQRVAASQGVKDLRTVHIDLGAIGGSALTSAAIAVPKHDDPRAPIGEGPIPVTYVPARNTVFLAIGLGFAETLGARDLFFGANALDYSGYPDCRPAFVHAFEGLANVATKDAVEGGHRFRVHAPLIAMTKSEIIRRGVTLGVDYGLTHSCYDPVQGLACGRCDACILRRRGFEEADVRDPTMYAPRT